MKRRSTMALALAFALLLAACGAEIAPTETPEPSAGESDSPPLYTMVSDDEETIEPTEPVGEAA